MREELLHVMQQMQENVVAQVSATVAGMEEEKSAALVSLKNEMAERKRLHNQVLDLKSHIRVFSRAYTHTHTHTRPGAGPQGQHPRLLPRATPLAGEQSCSDLRFRHGVGVRGVGQVTPLLL